MGMTMQRLSTRLTTFMPLIGTIFLAFAIYFATTPVLMIGRGYARHNASPTERLFAVLFMLAFMAFTFWQTLILYHVSRGKDGFLVSRFGKQHTIAFKDVTAIQLTFFGRWGLGALNRNKTVYIQYLGDDGRTQKIIFQVAQSVSKQSMWLEELQEILYT